MKIHKKLFLILFSFSLLLVTALVLLMQWSIGKGMVDYVNLKEVEALKPVVVKLADVYQKEGSWQTIQKNHKKFEDLLFSTLAGSEFAPPPPPRDLRKRADHEFRRPPPSEFAMVPPGAKTLQHPPRGRSDYILLNKNKRLITGHYDENFSYNEIAIVVNQENVGWFAIPQRYQITDGYELAFIEQQQSYLWLIALVTMMLVILVTLPLARHLVEPIKLITLGMHKLTQGHYFQQIDLSRQDELGELSRDFNELSATLHENENARKRWLANISHELRTPVAILRGELEAMLDDVRPLNKLNIDSANDEVKHLQSLIDDLHQLTSADIGGLHSQKENDNLSLWLSAEAQRYTDYLADAGIELKIQIDDDQADVLVDTTRLCQLFDNIMNNCIKYSQASLMKISLSVDKQLAKSIVRVTVEDNGVGVAAKHLPHLFEHLYRVESSRNRKTGGAGLGLSICAHIIAIHHGNIFAEQSTLGGLAIIIELPLNK